MLLTVIILPTLNQVNDHNRYDYQTSSHQKEHRDSNSNTDCNYNGQRGKDIAEHIILTTYYSQ